jgi:hypothetical protein
LGWQYSKEGWFSGEKIPLFSLAILVVPGFSLVHVKFEGVLVIAVCILLNWEGRMDKPIGFVALILIWVGNILTINRGGPWVCPFSQHSWHITLFMGCILVSGKSEGSLVSCVVVNPQFGSCLNFLDMENVLEFGKGSSAQEEEVVEENFTTIQKLIIKVNALSSIVSFSLEMLAQHWVLIGKLQDEVDYL